MRRLARDYPDHQIAGILARQGRLTGAGKPFTAHRVRSLRHHYNIPAATAHSDPPPGASRVTVAQAASELGVSTATIHRWLREGFITGAQITHNAPWQIDITPELRDRVRQQAPHGWLPLTEAANTLGLARQTVLHKVQRGELQAVYVQHGKRKGLRIQAKPNQAELFDKRVLHLDTVNAKRVTVTTCRRRRGRGRWSAASSGRTEPQTASRRAAHAGRSLPRQLH